MIPFSLEHLPHEPIQIEDKGILRQLLFAEDFALVSYSFCNSQNVVSAKCFGDETSVKKTELLLKPKHY